MYCVNYDNNSENLDKNTLDKLVHIINQYFSADDDFDNDIRRGLLTIGDNQFYHYWSSWLYAVEQPKYCLIEDMSDLRYFANKKDLNGENGMPFQEYLKILLLKLMDESLIDIIINFKPATTMPNWKKRLNFAKKEDDSEIWLIPKSKVENSDNGRKKLKLVK